MIRTLKFLLATLLLLAALLNTQAHAAADVDLTNGKATPFVVLVVNTGATKTVLLPDRWVRIVHLGVQGDSTTSSVAGDRLIVMRSKDEAGVAVTMAADLTAGVKLPIFYGGSATINGGDIPDGADGTHEIQMQAVGHSCMVLLIRGTK